MFLRAEGGRLPALEDWGWGREGCLLKCRCLGLAQIWLTQNLSVGSCIFNRLLVTPLHAEVGEALLWSLVLL